MLMESATKSKGKMPISPALESNGTGEFLGFRNKNK
jgi:hypothetical protein